MSETLEHAQLTEKQELTIVNFLSSNPDFFDRHPELLNTLELSHTNGETVSLIERQVKSLRQEVDQYKQRLEELVEIAHDNERLNQRMHRLTLNLIDTVDFDETLNVLQDKLHDNFGAEAVELHLFTHNEAEGNANADLDGYRNFLDDGIPVCGVLEMEQLEYLFGPQAEDINSTALIPIRSEGVLGLLAIGSTSKERFCDDMGTEYLSRLGEVISRTLEVVLEPGF
ncbi:MAG: DUF484 family protein [Gammaproteobacteria bacterium]|nr:DUF484 family protein [Gammaproteobacteria bacterium]